MQQWLNDPKNRPIVYGIAGVVMVGAIVFILFQVGVLGGATPYVPPATSTATGPPMPPSSMTPPTSQPGSGPPPAPGSQMASNKPPTSAGSPQHAAGAPSPAKKAPPTNVAQAPHAVARPASAPPPAGATPPAAQPVVVAGAVNPRSDPFAPYVDLAALINRARNARPPRPRVDTFAPAITITDYAPATTVAVVPPINGFQPGGQSTQIGTPIGRVSGVMLGTGAYAIVDNNGQSAVLQPGEQLPNGAGQLISIQSDSISVKVPGGQIVKVPISTGDNGANPGGAGPPQGNNGNT